MLKKKVIPIAKTTIGLKCGDCINFKINSKFEKPCSQLGIKAVGDAPNCFSPNVYLLGRKNPDALYQMGLLLRDFSAQESRVFMAVLKQARAFEKHYDLKFGQPVYFCIGNDFLNNYFHGFVIGVAESGDGQVFVGSDLKGRQRGKPMTATLLRDRVYTVSEWKKKQAQLVKENRINDPKPMFSNPKIPVKVGKEEYVPPSMDNVPSEWYTKEEKKGKKARMSSKKSLRKLDGHLEFRVSRS